MLNDFDKMSGSYGFWNRSSVKLPITWTLIFVEVVVLKAQSSGKQSFFALRRPHIVEYKRRTF